VRWFQFGLTSPVFRQHGARPVEPWVLQQYGKSGQAAYDAVVKMIRLRRALRPYVLEQMRAVADSGTPVNRPLSFDFPEDAQAWKVTDQVRAAATHLPPCPAAARHHHRSRNPRRQFMFGGRFMAAPVYHMGARSRRVYFPRGGAGACEGGWRQYAPAGTGNVTVPGLVGAAHAPGSTAEVEAPFDALPLFACGLKAQGVVESFYY